MPAPQKPDFERLANLNELLVRLGLRKRRSIRDAQQSIIQYAQQHQIAAVNFEDIYHTLSPPAAPAAPIFKPPTRWADTSEVKQQRLERLEQLKQKQQAIADEIAQIELLEGIESQPAHQQIPHDVRHGKYQLNQQLELLDNLPIGPEIE
jgi:hypothetical protein